MLAAELLLDRLADRGPEGAQEVVLPIEIIVRRSTARPSSGIDARATHVAVRPRRSRPDHPKRS